MKNRVMDFNLTRKWDRKIRKFAFDAEMPYEEALQEARIWEWKAQQKIQDLKHRENYFLKSLKFSLRKYGTTWWDTKRVKSTVPDLDIIDSLVTMRGFDELFYDYLVKDIANTLAQIDNVAVELFLARINTNKKWSKIRKDFPELSQFTFYKYINDIKRVVKKEVCLVS